MTQSKILTLELEVEVEYDEGSDGTLEFKDATCHTKVPITVEAWARHEAWMQMNRRKRCSL